MKWAKENNQSYGWRWTGIESKDTGDGYSTCILIFEK
jgi:hypothetical protein